MTQRHRDRVRHSTLIDSAEKSFKLTLSGKGLGCSLVRYVAPIGEQLTLKSSKHVTYKHKYNSRIFHGLVYHNVFINNYQQHLREIGS